MKRLKKDILRFIEIIDIVLVPAVYLAAILLKTIRRIGVNKMPFSKSVLLNVGVFPIRNHFYEPLFDSRLIRHSLDQERNLPGIDWNVDGQLSLLESFHFNEELKATLIKKDSEHSFQFNNSAFETGDAEFLYNIIRLKKPARVFEIGSGNSTRVVMKAIKKNQDEIPGYTCKHLCIEPYAAPWLDKSGLIVLRQPVETVDNAIFSELSSGDLLFIDSSHMIRPQGDVLFEYLEVLPSLKNGVIVHIHDIFSPRDYPKDWIEDKVRFWNEQYLLEAFLTCNPKWKILAGLNYLHHNHFEKLQEKCPFLVREREPGSFYIERVA